jgi:hypothetical protein
MVGCSRHLPFGGGAVDVLIVLVCAVSEMGGVRTFWTGWAWINLNTASIQQFYIQTDSGTWVLQSNRGHSLLFTIE